MLNNIIAFLVGLITASTTLYTHKTYYKILATKDLYYKTFFPIYLIIQTDIVRLDANRKLNIKKSESEIIDLKSKFKCVIKDSNGAFPNELNSYIQNLSPDNYIYFCRYIDDSCNACQKSIGYKPKATAYGKWRIILDNIIGFLLLLFLFYVIISCICFVLGSLTFYQFLKLLILSSFLLVLFILLLEHS